VRELSGLVPTAALGRLTLGLAFAVLAAACRSDDGSAEEGFSDEAETTQLECEQQGYPCTWAEVDPAILAQSAELTRQLRSRLREGASIGELAVELADDAAVESVMFDGVAVRFRLNGGRGVWLIDSSQLPVGARGAALRLPDEKTDPVGDMPPDEKPRKRALLLTPYQWEDRLGTKPCVVLSGQNPGKSCAATINVTPKQYKSLAKSLPSSGLKVEYEESELFEAIFADVRDYRCGKSKRCPCKGGSCIEHVQNYWKDGCDHKDAACRVKAQVTIEAFKDWKRFDVIHLGTHGAELCDASKKNCSTGIATGMLITYGQLETWANNEGPLLLEDSWWNEPGIEFVDVDPSIGCSELTPGSNAYRDAFCHVDAKCPGPGCDILYRVYLGLDFFKSYYKPSDLEDKLFFLNACVSMKYQKTLPHFLSAGGQSAVIGWSNYVPTPIAAAAAAEFYLHWLGGLTAHDAFQKIAKDKRFAKTLKPGFEGKQGLMRGDGPTGGSTELQTEGTVEKRGREIVFLLDPETDEDLEDGGWVQTIGAPDDGEDDELRVSFEVIGVDEDDDINDYELHLRVGDRELKESWKPDEQVDVSVWRREGTVELGFDTHDGQVEDIEVWTELPGGGISRWLYEDMHLGGPYWRMSFTGGEESGRYSGNAVEFRLAEDRWDGNSLSMRSQKSADPDVTIVAMMPPDFSLAPGTYPLCFSEHDYCAEVLFNPVTGDPLAQDWAGYVTGDGVTVDYPYDGGDMGPAFRYPPPATLTITRVTEDIIEGRIEGQLFKEVYTPKPVGHSRHFVMASATIQFAAERLKRP